MNYHHLIDRIKEELPGQQLWMQCVPVSDDDKPTEEGVGLSIQKRVHQDKKTFSPVFFRVVPKEEALDSSGAFLQDRGEDASDWTVEIGYQEPFGTLREAIEEAKVLARGLPMSPIFRTEKRRAAILDRVTDPDDPDDHPNGENLDVPGPDLGTPDLGTPDTGRSQIIRQEIVYPDPADKQPTDPR